MNEMMAMRSDSILVPNGVFTKTMNDSNDGFLFFFIIPFESRTIQIKSMFSTFGRTAIAEEFY